jgi:hypothetical protein
MAVKKFVKYKEKSQRNNSSKDVGVAIDFFTYAGIVRRVLAILLLNISPYSRLLSLDPCEFHFQLRTQKYRVTTKSLGSKS